MNTILLILEIGAGIITLGGGALGMILFVEKIINKVKRNTERISETKQNELKREEDIRKIIEKGQRIEIELITLRFKIKCLEQWAIKNGFEKLLCDIE